MPSVYTYDDGSQIMRADDGGVLSREIGAQTWQDDPLPAQSGWTVFSSDAAEQARMGAAYPGTSPWYESAAALGVSRVIDTAARAWVQVKGSQPATYAGQNGQTYIAGRTTSGALGGMSPLVLLLLVGVAAFALKKG